MPMNRALYPHDWEAIVARIRARAGNCCERCKAPNGKTIARGGWSDAGTYMLEGGEVHDENDGTYRGMARGSEYEAKRFVKIVLTTSHQDHDLSNNADSNLKSLCQRCHLRHDAAHHLANARRTREAKRGQRSLFKESQ